jgi:hypothetical protein
LNEFERESTKPKEEEEEEEEEEERKKCIWSLFVPNSSSFVRIQVRMRAVRSVLDSPFACTSRHEFEAFAFWTFKHETSAQLGRTSVVRSTVSIVTSASHCSASTPIDSIRIDSIVTIHCETLPSSATFSAK